MLGRFLAESASWERVPKDALTYVPEFAGTEGPFNVLATRGDAQGFAIVYRDPTLKDTGITDAQESAYRAGRPLLSYTAWLLTGGGRAPVAVGIFLVSWLSSIAAAAAVAMLARSRGLSMWWGLLGLVLPGGLGVLAYGGSDLLALTFAALALVLWPRHRVWAIAALTLGVLSRETVVIVAGGIALHGLFMERRPYPEVGIPLAAWLGWAAIVHSRFGAWPWESGAGQRLGFDLSVVVENPANVLNIVLLVFLVFVGMRRNRKDVLPWVALCSAVFLFVLGPDVLRSSANFARVLLPGYVTGILAVVATSIGRPVVIDLVEHDDGRVRSYATL